MVLPPHLHSNLSKGGTAWHWPRPCLPCMATMSQYRDAATSPIPVGSHSKSSGDPAMTNITGGKARQRTPTRALLLSQSKLPAPGDHILLGVSPPLGTSPSSMASRNSIFSPFYPVDDLAASLQCRH
ncbi:hypothetical protein E2C01_050178 [Portunus trituberculatus]|uniref:Uncharacterized protein n=1 Tax=Portunus trituberculatus TaxID=210409 RepID=A0A5B7GF70_PORTR|nr:hypothetical protein [Portunus trituberculatus]